MDHLHGGPTGYLAIATSSFLIGQQSALICHLFGWGLIPTSDILPREQSNKGVRAMVQKLPQPLIDLYNVYIHGGMSRREFMEGIEKFAVTGLTVAAIAEALMPNYALGEVVPKNDSRLKTEYI